MMRMMKKWIKREARSPPQAQRTHVEGENTVMCFNHQSKVATPIDANQHVLFCITIHYNNYKYDINDVTYLSNSSSRLSNGETESVKTMVVLEDDDASSTPCKDSTLVVRQVIHTCMKLKKLLVVDVVVVYAYCMPLQSYTTATECSHSLL